MAEDKLKKLNERLGGKSADKTRNVGSDDSEQKDGVKTIDNPAEAFGAKAAEEKTVKKESEPKKRGWPKGKPRPTARGRAGTAAKENKTVIEGVSQTLFGIHFFAANAFNASEFILSEDESEKIALAIQRVSDQYGKVIDPKTEAWVGLMGILGACYGPRVISYNMRKKAENKQPQPQPQKASGLPTPQEKSKPVDKKAQPSKKDATPGNPSDMFGALNVDPNEGPL